MPSAPVASGVLSKMTVPRSRTVREADDLRCDIHHHVPNADPTTLARIPRVRLLTVASPHGLSNLGATEQIQERGPVAIVPLPQLDHRSRRKEPLLHGRKLRWIEESLMKHEVPNAVGA
jgi:hypothetical protein